MIKKACLICAVVMWLVLLLNSPKESQRLGASPLELEVVPSGPNFLIRRYTVIQLPVNLLLPLIRRISCSVGLKIAT